MHTELFEKTAKLEEVLSYKQQHTVWYSKRLSNQEISDVPHATAGLFIENNKN